MPRYLAALFVLGCLPMPGQTQTETSIPKAMQVCVAVCAALQWDGKQFVVLNHDGVPAITYTVESFTPDSVVLRRAELRNSPAYGLTAAYKGSLDAGGKAAHGTVYFTWPGHPGFPHGGNWTATWGANLGQAQYAAQPTPHHLEERGEAEDAQSASEEQARKISAGALNFFMYLLGATPPDSAASGGDPSGRIDALKSRIDELHSQCAGDPVRDSSGACAREKDLRGDLDDAYGALSDEIDALKAQAAQLEKDCAANVAGSCQKLNQVKERLEADIESRLSGIF